MKFSSYHAAQLKTLTGSLCPRAQIQTSHTVLVFPHQHPQKVISQLWTFLIIDLFSSEILCLLPSKESISLFFISLAHLKFHLKHPFMVT